MGLIRKLRKAKKEAPPNEKPRMVKTHLRDMIVVPEMIGSVIGIYNGKVRCDLEGVLSSCHLTDLSLSGFQQRRNQARDGWSLHWRVLDHLQACATRSSRYRCHPLFTIVSDKASYMSECCRSDRSIFAASLSSKGCFHPLSSLTFCRLLHFITLYDFTRPIMPPMAPPKTFLE